MNIRNNLPIAEQIRHQVTAILSSLDRDPFSKTAGSFDRLFWGWKLKDYSDATLQRLMYPLARYYFKIDSSLCNKKIFLDWILSSFSFLGKLQHRDGSFDQAFPHEHSHGATAFLLFDCASTFRIIEKKINMEAKTGIIKTLKKMGGYLVKFDEKHGFISNHLLGAASGLQILYIITGDIQYKSRARFYVDKVLSFQSKEGWYPEYGGADPGYQTLAIYYLSHYYKFTGDENVLNSLKNAIDFISYFIHPDGSFGGEYGSRNTEIFYPGGIALLQNEIALAKRILTFMTASIEGGQTVNLTGIDAGNLAPFINNYLDVITSKARKADDEGSGIPFFNSEFTKEFKEAGIVVYKCDHTYAVIGLSKGGVIKEFDKEKGVKLRDDCGYIGKLKAGKLISTQNFSSPTYSLENNKLALSADFYEVSQSIPDPYKFFLLRCFNLTAGMIRSFRETVKRVLVKTLLSNQKKTEFILKREITLASPLAVKDTIMPSSYEDSFDYLQHGIKFSTIHMASSKYFYK